MPFYVQHVCGHYRCLIIICYLLYCLRLFNLFWLIAQKEIIGRNDRAIVDASEAMAHVITPTNVALQEN